MRNYAARLTLIAVTVALLIVGGGFIYATSYLLGNSQVLKIILMSLYFTILLYLLLLRSPKLGTLSMLSVVLGVILSIFSPIMTLAIVFTGILSDLLSYLIFKGYGSGKKLIVSVAFYPLFSVITSLFFVSRFTAKLPSNKLSILYLAGGIGAFILGIIGGYLGQYIDKKYIHVSKLEDVI
ncbi:hypothetical protein [Clostridium manihotivorum]|uniref:Energy-coupling factor transport system substrate-specific component n=1 Tax=Clostridium manihotivorum TaxID=2320868 RepID=A0A3R5TIM7_9CLOT|nr:hypothetical protein [Clostridium manihotivorum]QAA34374.1 hypothetical protein C1I91_23545 [Clostridium manihotivorum]